MTKISSTEFEQWRGLVKRLCGLALDQTKAYLIETRLSLLLRQHGCTNFGQLYQKVSTDQTGLLHAQVIEAVTTKETYWFRDVSPFVALQQKVLPDLIKANPAGRPIRIWSAACSTGQEVYTIAMVAYEAILTRGNLDIRILGTDISDQAIAIASYGRYSEFEAGRGLPQDKLQRYFYKDATGWRIKDELRALCCFRKLNLLDPFGHLGRFDVVFCRNVAIYFSPQDRKALFERIADVLQPTGYLFIGASEYLTGITDRFQAYRHAGGVFYMPRAPVTVGQQLQPAMAALY